MNDRQFVAVKKNQLDPVQACLTLLKSVYLDADLQIQGSPAYNRNEAFGIFQKFHTFHTSWFQNINLLQAGADSGTSIIYDASEMAYSLDKVLFSKNSQYSDILLEKQSYLAKRSDGKSNYFQDIDQFQDRPKIKSGSKFVAGWGKKLLEWETDLIEVGEITGLKINPVRKPVSYVNDTESYNYGITSRPGQGFNEGGILGSASYLLANTTLKENSPSDGAMQMHRNWSKSFFGDILCRDLPVLREEDIFSEVEEKSEIPFRKDKLCMTCHSTMDPFAAVIRNAVVIASNDGDGKFTSKLMGVVTTTEKAGAITPKKSDPQYSQRPTDGALKFRTFNGELINKKVRSLSELGAEVAKTDDFYICAAKKYFQFFTGIDVKIRDFSQEAAISPQESKYIDFIVSLGAGLKKEQHPMTIIEKILRSDFYKVQNFE